MRANILAQLRVLMSWARLNAPGCPDPSGTEVSQSVIQAHQEADLQRRLRYADSMELPELGDEIVDDLYLDVSDSIQQLQPELVPKGTYTQPLEMEINQATLNSPSGYRAGVGETSSANLNRTGIFAI
ncbi:unnamed protein product [Echinostoma caproni]|uniref:Amyloid beta precursor protein binding family A member 1 n=1 Tax=Echinostoma caproni TaxID=27848 RepID=A0A183BG32_9TREM|nr:unnamed protein product [Echinostoma caproni]